MSSDGSMDLPSSAEPSSDESPDSEESTATAESKPKERIQLSPRQRRVFGVLVEKAKTTPDAYPLSLNGLMNGCNQKSNRSPIMNLDADEVQNAVDELRHMRGAMEVQGNARVPKYRHQAYEWLDVDKFEMAVMAELLLRGEQTVGELRGRANRMTPIADLGALRPILHSLIDKGFVISLTPEGRGQMVTHNFYKDREMDGLQERTAQAVAASEASASGAGAPRRAPPAAASAAITLDMFNEMQLEVAQLQADVAQLRSQMRQLGHESRDGTEDQ
jgi:uncharacterized protein YceH (UPF0502 family)